MTIQACSVCRRFACVCMARKNHRDDCKFLRAVSGPVAIECEHGRDVCGVCDPCTCGAGIKGEDL
jgi:hypothetical protein